MKFNIKACFVTFMDKYKKNIAYLFYAMIPKHLPRSEWNRPAKAVRGGVLRAYLLSAGKKINIDAGAEVRWGVTIGDYSSIGMYSRVQNGTKIGDNVMMGLYRLVYTMNHRIYDLRVNL